MSKRLLTCSVATIAVLAVTLGPRASAQPIEGLYVAGGIGGNFMQRSSIGVNLGGAGVGVNGVGETNMYFDAGFAGVASVGWGFGNGLRTEAEFGYRNNGVSSVSGIYDSPNVHAGGNEEKFGLMVNVLYDFEGLTPWVTPYLGVGAGYQWVDLNGVDVSNNVGDRLNIDGTEGAFAYQAIVGVAYPLPQVPGLALTAEYRFMGLTGNRNYSATAAGPARSVSTSVRAGDEFNHSLLIGIRYAFYTPAPPPPPAPVPVAAPAPAPSRSYLVFFDWDKATLTDRARQVIRNAAENSTHVQYTRIDVNGYTDTTGTAKYNQALSVRRAEAVAGELVRDGVPRQAITARGFGDTHLLVSTGPGVREPQNRRVEIVLQ